MVKKTKMQRTQRFYKIKIRVIKDTCAVCAGDGVEEDSWQPCPYCAGTGFIRYEQRGDSYFEFL